MRAIKFRAWDKKRLIMYQSILPLSDGMFLQETANTPGACPGAVKINEELPKDFAIMQFTGLKDKNGKEIYEGDIVKWAKNDKETLTLFIAYEKNVMGFVATKSDDRYAQTVRMKSFREDRKIKDGSVPYIEVIGNIHENPELLPEPLDDEPINTDKGCEILSNI